VAPLWRGMLETAGLLTGFLAFGLAWAALAAPTRPPPYAPWQMERRGDAEPPQVWLIDGYNVLCSGLLGGRDRSTWWSTERRRELLGLLEHFDAPQAEIWVVFDGERQAGAATRGRVSSVFVPSADRWIHRQVKERATAESVAVVTSDRQLAGRARHGGARVISPGALLRRCKG